MRYRDAVHMAILRISHRVLSFGTCLYANEESERSIIKELNYGIFGYHMTIISCLGNVGTIDVAIVW